MQKTLAALDDLLSSVITLVPTWCSMLKSTRFLTVLIIIGVLIWAWKFSGLTDVQAQIVSVVGGLLGVNFDWVKTIGKKYETAVPAAAAAPAAADAGPASPKLSTGSLASYNTPIDIDAYIKGLGASLYDQFAECKNVISNYNLLAIHPDIRVTVAAQVVDKAIALAVAVWPSLVGTGSGSDGKPYYRAPEASDYRDYASRQSFDKAVRDAIPGCQYMPEGAYILFRDLEELYSYRSNLALLEGKSVRWYEADGKQPRIKYIYTLANLGLAAVA